MRSTHSFLLRLLIDPACPQVLRGTLHVITDAQDYAFADDQALLDLLRHLTARLAADQALGDEAFANLEDT